MEKSTFDIYEYYEIPIGDAFVLDARTKISTSSNREVHLGRKRDDNKLVSIKLEKICHSPTLFKEAKALMHLKDIQRIPNLIWMGEQGRYFILIMDLLGPSLGSLKKKCNGKFSLATTLKISVQILKILEQIHAKGVIIRYLKPDNMVLGLKDNENFVYLIDFGTAKFYMKKGEHIKYVENKYHIKGNRDFISINYHKRIEASRRDDIESLGYNLVNFMKGKLPWTHLNDSKLILQKKIDTSLDELCEGLPGEFKEFIDYARKLEFKEKPNYSYLNELLIKAAKDNGIDLDKVEYDWTNLKINEKEVKDESSNEEHKENEIKESENGTETKDDNKKENKELINDELNDKNEDNSIKKEEIIENNMQEKENSEENKKINANEIISQENRQEEEKMK